MKKLKYLLLVFIILFAPTFVKANEKVKVNIFKSSTCPHCADAMEFFNDLAKDSEFSNYFELVSFETNGNSETIKNNIELAEKVAKHFGYAFEGVPLIVIGEEYFEGYISSMNTELKDAIKSAYNNSNYIDIVSELKNGTIKNSNFGTIITILICLVFVGGIGYLVYIGRKNPIEEVTESKEEKEESTVSKTKSPNVKKKTTTKKATSTKSKK